MRVDRKIDLERVLQHTLPGSGLESAGHGKWQTTAGKAEWQLVPDGSGFWLVLWSTLDQPRSGHGPIAQSGGWPWPLKPVRREPGAELYWAAEIRLEGKAENVKEIGALVQSIEAWLRGHNGPSATTGGRSPDRTEPHALADAADLIVHALGNSLKRTDHGFRLPSPDGPALLIRGSTEGLVFRSSLARGVDVQSGAGSTCLDDFVAVANGRLRGCRGFLELRGATADVVLETLVRRACLTVNRIRAAADSLCCAASPLSAACEVLVQHSRVRALYNTLLVGDGKQAHAMRV